MSKYNVYANDLKFRKFRDIDKNRATMDSKTEELYNTNLDTLEYRMKEFHINNDGILDLKFLNLKDFPELPNNIIGKVTALLISNNSLTKIPNLSMFTKLQVLDCSHNLLKEVNIISKTITELSCNFNEIEQIENIPSLTKLDCEGNSLITIPSFPNLEILYCHKNKIESIPKLLQVKKIICHTNNIKFIDNNLPIIEYIDCRNNKLENIFNYVTLKELFINNNPISNLPNIPNLILIECFNTNVNTIIFLPKLKEIICDYRDTISFSKDYKLNNENINLHKQKYLIVKTNLNVQ